MRLILEVKFLNENINDTYLLHTENICFCYFNYFNDFNDFNEFLLVWLCINVELELFSFMQPFHNFKQSSEVISLHIEIVISI